MSDVVRWLVLEPDAWGHPVHRNRYVTGQTRVQAERKAKALYGDQVWVQSEPSYQNRPLRASRLLARRRQEDREWLESRQAYRRDWDYQKYHDLDEEYGEETGNDGDWPKPAA